MSKPAQRISRAFDRDALKRVCEMHETDFEAAYGLRKVEIDPMDLPRFHDAEDNFYLHLDRGSDILAVAHLDTCVRHEQRTTQFLKTGGGEEVCFSGALDDRLGAYTILELLPKLGIEHDLLLTVGEEQGNSTAQFFDPPEGKKYNWLIEFDRGGTDVVMYQYDSPELRALVRASGARPSDGSFSDIAYLGHLGSKGLNWGVGYRDYHTTRGHVWLQDYWMMIGHYLKFHKANADLILPHSRADERRNGWIGGGYGSYGVAGGGSGPYGNGNWWDEEVEDDPLASLEDRLEAAYARQDWTLAQELEDELEDQIRQREIDAVIDAECDQRADEIAEEYAEFAAQHSLLPSEKKDAEIIGNLFGLPKGTGDPEVDATLDQIRNRVGAAE